jgi:glutaminyl-peptide cyclotransferase
MNRIFITSILLLLISIQACKFGQEDTPTEAKLKSAPKFNADNAYSHIVQQVNFGPRVPGTSAQVNCAAYLEQQLKAVTDTVYIQKIIVTQPVSNKKINCINIIGAINPKAATRVLLLCHWDSRPFADNDGDKANHAKAIDAADDGASGPAVLLEMARAIKQQPLDIGVDILFADVEDMGKSEWEQEGQESTYCLGTRYWAQNPHIANYKANYGICLDMVGASNATFYLEGYSKQNAPELVDKVWSLAAQIGHSGYFSYTPGGGITDDHVEVIKYAKIPCIDIINTSMSSATGFGNHWHTMNDNIKVIDKKTLNAVGETLLTYLYNY